MLLEEGIEIPEVEKLGFNFLLAGLKLRFAMIDS